MGRNREWESSELNSEGNDFPSLPFSGERNTRQIRLDVSPVYLAEPLEPGVDPVPEPEVPRVELPLPEGEPLSVEPLGDDPVPAGLPRLELPVPGVELLGELLPVAELPAPMVDESWTPNALAVLLSSWPLCWMFCAR